MRLMQRMELHNALRRIARDEDVEQLDKDAAAKILAHDEALAILEMRVDRSATKAGMSAGPIQNFLQWLIDNEAQVIAFVKAILKMFGL